MYRATAHRISLKQMITEYYCIVTPNMLALVELCVTSFIRDNKHNLRSVPPNTGHAELSRSVAGCLNRVPVLFS